MSLKSRVIPPAVALAVIILTVILYPQPLNTLQALGQAGETLFSPDLFLQLARQAGTPRAGEQVLPPQVQAMLFLLRTNNVTSYCYSASIGKNEEIRQRLIEGALPARFRETAPYVLMIESEQAPRPCRSLASREGVLLVYCP
ncbi:MAG: hypothetical protein M0042_13860 [Nitrospiraceae bacterium]|nr:hypothetical protein [Nitrospiraceae bacterium]